FYIKKYKIQELRVGDLGYDHYLCLGILDDTLLPFVTMEGILSMCMITPLYDYNSDKGKKDQNPIFKNSPNSPNDKQLAELNRFAKNCMDVTRISKNLRAIRSLAIKRILPIITINVVGDMKNFVV
ncbi:28015_t:CDS:2, partial [Gigaspora margarita]